MTDQLNFHKKRRRVTHSFLTKLATKLTGLESTTKNPDTLRNVLGLATKLKALDAEFRTHHLSIIDLTEEEEALTEEQQALDDHDNQVSELNIRIQRLTSLLTPSSASNLRKSSLRRLAHLKVKIASIRGSIEVVTNNDDGVCTLQQYQEQIADLKKELKEIQSPLLEVDLERSDPLIEAQDAVERDIFQCSLAIKKCLHSTAVIKPSATPEATGAKLPKLEVPTYNGDILCWKGFWEQFCVSVHDWVNLTNAEKLVYLQNAIKDNTAKRTIEGLTKSGEHYEEAVKCLQFRYDRPCLIHQTHVHQILDAPSLRDRSSKELRTLHDVVLQHLRALKTMGHEPSNSFITPLLDSKLDPNTMFDILRSMQMYPTARSCSIS